jgi:hypothetical protein
METLKINWALFSITILLMIGFVWSCYDNMNLKQELEGRQRIMLDLMESYHACDDREQCQNKCLWDNRATDYEDCYWKCVTK